MIDEIPVEAATESADVAVVGHLWAHVADRHVMDQLIARLESFLANSTDKLAALSPVNLLHVWLHRERSLKVLGSKKKPHHRR